MSSACPTVDLIMVAVRAVQLLICTAAGPYMIHLGARMYREAISLKSSGEVTGMGFKLVLKSAGPGLFLIAFGAGLLLFIVNRPLVLSDETQSATPSATVDAAASLIGQAVTAMLPAAHAADGASAPEGSRRTCILQVRKREFANGIDPLSRESVVKTLDAAIVALRAAQGQGIADPDERAEVLNGLGALRQAASDSP